MAGGRLVSRSSNSCPSAYEGSPVADAPRKLSGKRKKGDDECQPAPAKLPDNIPIHGCAASHKVEVQSFQLVATSENRAMEKGPEKMSTTCSPKDRVEAEGFDASPEVPVTRPLSIANSDNAKDLEEDEQEEVQSITSICYASTSPIPEVEAERIDTSSSPAISDDAHKSEEDEDEEAQSTTSDSYLLSPILKAVNLPWPLFFRAHIFVGPGTAGP